MIVTCISGAEFVKWPLYCVCACTQSAVALHRRRARLRCVARWSVCVGVVGFCRVAYSGWWSVYVGVAGLLMVSLCWCCWIFLCCIFWLVVSVCWCCCIADGQFMLVFGLLIIGCCWCCWFFTTLCARCGLSVGFVCLHLLLVSVSVWLVLSQLSVLQPKC